MKIEKFLKWIQHNLLNTPDISLITIKLFIQEFQNCLSESENIRWSLQIQIINELTLKQISLDTFVHNTRVEYLDNQLNNLKNDVNEKNKIQTKKR